MDNKPIAICKKCLLEEASMQEASVKVKNYINRIDIDIRTPKKQYTGRLQTCRSCKHLISGTCSKCGCFVEMRAAVINNHCPDIPSKW